MSRNAPSFTDTRRIKQERLLSGIPDSIDVRVYNLVIGGLLLYGFALNALLVELFSDRLASMERPWFLVIIYFVCCIAGSFLARSTKPLVSFAGYNLIALPIGLLLAAVLPGFPKSEVMTAIVATAAVTAGMVAVSMLIPDFFAKIGRALFFSLIIGIVVQLVAVLLLGYGGNAFNWFFVILFSLYIGYDWYRAQAYPKTLDNAIDSAIDLYLDIVNIFLRIIYILNNDRD